MNKAFGILGVAFLLSACGEEPVVGSSSAAVCSTVTASTSPAPGGAVGDPVVVTGTPGCEGGDTPYYRFYLYSPGTGWSLAQDWSTTSTYNWDTTGLAEGKYYFQVWIRAGGPGAAEAYSSVGYQLGSSPCTGGGLSANPASPQPEGTPVQLTGSATCGGIPHYRFYHLAPGGSWQMVQDYSEVATYNWNTATPGTHYFQVWVRNSVSTATYETYGYLSFNVGQPCSGGTISYSPPTGTTVGKTVFVIGGASCPGSQATYRFWRLAPGGTYESVQDWSTQNYYAWDTTGVAQGTWWFQVWVRRNGSTEIYETWAGNPYNVYAECTGAGISFSDASPQPAGTAITVTGSGTCGGTPEYRYYLLPPGGTWQLAQDWSPNAYNWDTTGLAAGTYSFQVWVRNQGTSTTYDTYANGSFELTAP